MEKVSNISSPKKEARQQGVCIYFTRDEIHFIDQLAQKGCSKRGVFLKAKIKEMLRNEKVEGLINPF